MDEFNGTYKGFIFTLDILFGNSMVECEVVIGDGNVNFRAANASADAEESTLSMSDFITASSEQKARISEIFSTQTGDDILDEQITRFSSDITVYLQDNTFTVLIFSRDSKSDTISLAMSFGDPSSYIFLDNQTENDCFERTLLELEKRYGINITDIPRLPKKERVK